jgi:hypothetical protein
VLLVLLDLNPQTSKALHSILLGSDLEVTN